MHGQAPHNTPGGRYPDLQRSLSFLPQVALCPTCWGSMGLSPNRSPSATHGRSSAASPISMTTTFFTEISRVGVLILLVFVVVIFYLIKRTILLFFV